MSRDPGSSTKAQRDQLRERMRGYGCTVGQIAAEMGRRFQVRPRLAWRYALGWAQWKVALEYNTTHPGARLSDRRVSDHENWPHGGTSPSPRYLAGLAATFGHGCTPAQLVDADDLAEMIPADRCLLTTGHPLATTGATALGSRIGPVAARATVAACSTNGEHSDTGRALSPGQGDTGIVRRSRRIVRCDAWGVPVGEEVIVAAEESAQFWRWSATTNIDDTVLEQMSADVAEIARREQLDPPATTFATLLRARDNVFALIEGHQQPRHTTSLYKIASQLCGMLALVTFDLGYPHAANTQANTALHCADVSGYAQVRGFVRWVQSAVAYWDGRYDEAAQLVEAALTEATSGTTLLRLASQQARINAARHRPDEVSRALSLAETAPSERTTDEPGVLGYDTGMAALHASETHYALGGTDHLDAAVDWAQIALDDFTTQARPRIQSFAGARFDLALAYLGKGDLDAVGEHLTPILGATGAEYRTVPIIGRARSLQTLLAQRPDLVSATLTTLRDDIAGFITHPVPTPPQLDPGAAN